jgi:hypothetical protein
MQSSKQNNYFKSAALFVLSGAVMVLLFSCSKSTDEILAAPGNTSVANGPVASLQAANTAHSVPVNSTYFVSCANGGAGEEVELSGKLNVVLQYTVNDNRYTLTYHVNPQGLSGTGLTTGEKFTGSGGSQGTQSGSLSDDQFTYTFTEQLRIVSARSSLIVNYKFHVTVTPEGQFTTSISDERVVCRT